MFTTEAMTIGIHTATVHTSVDALSIVPMPMIGVMTFITSTSESTTMVGQIWPRGN